jgi:ABC-type cobalamin/Fe3+-siderophores transport system ATPase subunit
MQLKNLYIKNYKNLIEFELPFNHKPDNPNTLLIGKNGAGKSNLIEAIVFIFRNLYYSESLPIPFTFKIEYEIQNTKIRIHSIEDEKIKYRIWINESEVPISDIQKVSKTWKYEKLEEKLEGILPESILVYYSGYSTRLEHLFEKPTDDFAKSLRKNVSWSFRPFFYYKPIHYRFILLALFASELPDIKEKLLKKKLNINSLQNFDIILKKPDWNTDKDSTHHTFWRAQGQALNFFKLLKEVSDSSYGSDVLSDNEYVLRFKASDLRKIVASPIISWEMNLVKLLDSAELGGYINRINLHFKKSNTKVPIEFESLSEGEQQYMAIKGAIELLREKETLFLLDEPDTFLHPDWQRDLMDTLNDGSFKDHYLMTTHSPQVLGKVHSENIVVLKEGKPYSISSPTINRDTNSILEEIFDVTERPKEAEKLIKEIFDLLSQNKIEPGLKKAENLKLILNSKDPVFLKIDAIVKRKELLGK